MSTGRRGPAPEPAAIKKAKGNPGRRKMIPENDAHENRQGFINDQSFSGGGAVSDTATTTFEPPKWVSDDGLAVWDRLVDKLVQMRIMQAIDVDTFARYCQNFGRWVKLQKIIADEGETYISTSPHGEYKRLHPAVMMADRLDRTLMTFEQNFALNPADRQRLFAARAAAGAGWGDLFGNSDGDRGGDEQDQRAGKASAPSGPIGLLN